MSVLEKDPRITGYIALFTAITWYQDIDSESAFRIVYGQSHRKHGQKVNPILLKDIRRILDSPNYSNIEAVVKRFRVNKYDIYESISGSKNADEEAVLVPKIESELKRLSDRASDCPGVNCENCALNNIIIGENSLCEIICDLEFEQDGKLKKSENRTLQKTAKSCNQEMLTGETTVRGFEVYKSVLEKYDQFTGEHKNKKKRDIASAALLEYLSRQKCK